MSNQLPNPFENYTGKVKQPSRPAPPPKVARKPKRSRSKRKS